MSELYVTTSLKNFAFAVKIRDRVITEVCESCERFVEFFEKYKKITHDFPPQGLRKIYIDTGPGSFTGLKIGVAFARTLSQILKIPLYPVDVLEILAYGIERCSAIVDAGNGMVYSALFENGRRISDEFIIEIEEWLDYIEGEGFEVVVLLPDKFLQVMDERGIKYKNLQAGEVIYKMIEYAKTQDLKTFSFNEVLPNYISSKEKEKKWKKVLEGMMMKIKELKEEIKKNYRELNEIRAEKEQKQKEIEALNELEKQAHNLRKEIQEKMDELLVLNAKRTGYIESIKEFEKKIAALQYREEELKEEIGKIEEKIKEREKEFEKLRELPPDIPEEVALYAEQKETLERQIQNLKKEIEELKIEKERQIQELDEISSSRFEEVFSRIKKEEEEIEKITEIRKTKEQEVEMLSQKAQKLKSQIEELQKQIEANQQILEEKTHEEELEQKEEKEQISEIELPEEVEVQVEGKIQEKEKEEQEAREEAPEEKEEEEKREEIPSMEKKVPEEEKTEEERKEQEVSEQLRIQQKAQPLPDVKISGLDYFIRNFRISDLPDVMRIEEASFERPWRRQMFKEELSIPVSKLYCIEGRWGRTGRRKLFGYGVFWVVNEKAHIINFAIAPEERGKGIGKLFLKEILKKAKMFGCKAAYVEVRASAVAAQKLFESMDFQNVGLRKDYFGYPKEDAIIYERAI